MYMAMSRSEDLRQWSERLLLTPRGQNLNFSSPGNLIYVDNRWRMCLQSYPRPNGEKYGNGDCRIWMMESEDLVNWTAPELLRVKGEHVVVEDMGRMIDPYFIANANNPGEWLCFYKQNGVSLSKTSDFQQWIYCGSEQAGENVCIIRHQEEYVMFHSPENGIGMLRSHDLVHWHQEGDLLTLGQQQWEWAQGRLTAGFVLDLRGTKGIEAFVMFFHGSGPEDESVLFDTHASIGIAWSRDLKMWDWPGKV
ncbi:hypothetical protein J2736_003461 [Paenibacillus qinlingensis]|uniref:Uncharacterized protein n=1 Tax=Paenibacillus qinlingensis TaxID=1837343 RepID=A0ABU1NY87_9BACL|nr:hypothetical protein [Paenibacillus qinlingensis]